MKRPSRITQNMQAKGFNGHETERELLFYVIERLDSFDSKNSSDHDAIKATSSGLCKQINKQQFDTKYMKLGIYGAWLTLLFVLGQLFL